MDTDLGPNMKKLYEEPRNGSPSSDRGLPSGEEQRLSLASAGCCWASNYWSLRRLPVFLLRWWTFGSASGLKLSSAHPVELEMAKSRSYLESQIAQKSSPVYNKVAHN